MINIRFSNHFKHRYKQRIAKNHKLKKEFFSAIEIFKEERQSRSINDHRLNRKQYQFRSFSIDEDYRIVYLEKRDYILFVDVGTHEEVYN